jgi:hypothetical protein
MGDSAGRIGVVRPSILLLAGSVGVCDVLAGRVGVHPRGVSGSLSACMYELHADLGTLGVAEVDNTLQRSNL